jgi:hypothetical protein
MNGRVGVVGGVILTGSYQHVNNSKHGLFKRLNLRSVYIMWTTCAQSDMNVLYINRVDFFDFFLYNYERII